MVFPRSAEEKVGYAMMSWIYTILAPFIIVLTLGREDLSSTTTNMSTISLRGQKYARNVSFSPRGPQNLFHPDTNPDGIVSFADAENVSGGVRQRRRTVSQSTRVSLTAPVLDGARDYCIFEQPCLY